MTRLRILFDADDVAETLLEGWVKTLNERYGTTTSVEDVTDWDVSKAFPTLTKQQIYGVLQEDEVWAKLTPMPGAQEYLKRLHDEGHELYMVTATDYRTCRVKIERILELFPFLDANHIIIAHNNLSDNIPAVMTVLRYIYDNIMYAELNTKSDYCQCCGWDKEIEIVQNEHGKLIWRCPNCGNTDKSKMNIARRTCGYIGLNDWNQGRTQEIKERYVHLGSAE